MELQLPSGSVTRQRKSAAFGSPPHAAAPTAEANISVASFPTERTRTGNFCMRSPYEYSIRLMAYSSTRTTVGKLSMPEQQTHYGEVRAEDVPDPADHPGHS